MRAVHLTSSDPAEDVRKEPVDFLGCASFGDPLDPGRIAAAVDVLLSDETRARAIGRRGAIAVRDYPNWEQEAPKLLDLYGPLAVPAVA